MKKTRLTMGLVASALLVGCGGPDYGMTDQELAKSLEGFNKYCMSNSDDEMIKTQQIEDSEAAEKAYMALTMYGADLDETGKTTPLESYAQLEDAGHDGLWCVVPSNNDNFVLPDLSHLNLGIAYSGETNAITIIPDGMSVRSLMVTSRSIDSLKDLSSVTIEADDIDRFTQAHFTLYEGSGDLYLPEAWNLDVSGDRPFTVRLEMQLDGYGGLKDLDSAHVVFGESVYTKNVELMPADSAFCENYGSGTQAFLDRGQMEMGLEAGPEDWKELPAKSVCNA